MTARARLRSKHCSRNHIRHYSTWSGYHSLTFILINHSISLIDVRKLWHQQDLTSSLTIIFVKSHKKLQHSLMLWLLKKFFRSRTCTSWRRHYRIIFIPQILQSRVIQWHRRDTLNKSKNLLMQLKNTRAIYLVKPLLKIFPNQVWIWTIKNSTVKIFTYIAQYSRKIYGITAIPKSNQIPCELCLLHYSIDKSNLILPKQS